MIAACISAVSDFSAVNLNLEWLPASIHRLWPSIIGVALMSRCKKSFKQKFAKGKKINELADVEIFHE